MALWKGAGAIGDHALIHKLELHKLGKNLEDTKKQLPNSLKFSLVKYFLIWIHRLVVAGDDMTENSSRGDVFYFDEYFGLSQKEVSKQYSEKKRLNYSFQRLNISTSILFALLSEKDYQSLIWA